MISGYIDLRTYKPQPLLRGRIEKMPRKTTRVGSSAVQNAVFNELQVILSKPRTNAHSPQALVEVCYALMNLVYEDRRHIRHMNNEYAGNKAWYLDDNLDFTIVTNRLQKMVEKYKDE